MFVWLFYFDLPAYMDQLRPCTNVFSTAYAHVRTEPKSDIGQTRGKKAMKALDGKKNTWYSAERSVTLHSFDFTKYRLWTSLF